MIDAVPFEPLPWQVGPLNDKSPVILLTGSAGGGKSLVAAEKVNAYMLKYPGARGLLIRKAREYATKSMVPLMRSVIPYSVGRYRKSDMMFEYKNGSMIAVGGMRDEDQREAIRSIFERGGLDIVWIEEANALTYEDYQELRVRMRGKATSWRQIILTTNPGGAAHWIKRRLIDGGEAVVYRSSAVDNPHNPSDYISVLNTLTGLQYDRLVRGLWKSAEGALWSYDTIEAGRCPKPPLEDLVLITIGVDPAVTAKPDSDETGIIVAGVDAAGIGYVLQDLSMRASPATWAQAVVKAYHRWNADFVVAEVNNGGDMVAHTINTEDEDVPVRAVRASRGKWVRAQPIAALYEQGKVRHAGDFHDLEDQLTSWVPGNESPDRLDALVWGLSAIMLTPSVDTSADRWIVA